jgi:hypothetical protein
LVLHHRLVFRLLSVTESRQRSRLIQVNAPLATPNHPLCCLDELVEKRRNVCVMRPPSPSCCLAARAIQEQELAGKQHKSRLTAMQKFFFDMIDGVPFRDRIGIEFKTDADAIAHCGALAQHFFDESLTDDPDLEISVVNASGREIHREFVHRR